MARKDKPSGFKLKSELTRALALTQAGRCEEAVPLLRDLAPRLRTSDAYRLLVHCLDTLGRTADMQATLLEAARAFPAEPDLSIHAALGRYEQDDYAEAVALFGRVPAGQIDEPEILARYAHALLVVDRPGDALQRAAAAYGRHHSGVPALVFGLASTQAGELERAEEALRRAAESLEDPQRALADSLLGLVLFWRGEIAAAVDRWKELDARAGLGGEVRHFFAIGLAMLGDEPGARAALARAPDASSPASRLAQARVELALNHPDEALAALALVSERSPLDDLIAATRGRALRIAGRLAEAREVLEPLASAFRGTLAAMVAVDLGRIDSEGGRHEEAATRFEQALASDPSSPDAAEGLRLARERTAWRTAVAADAAGQVAAARAEAEAMRRAFAERERELEMLRARLAQAEKAAKGLQRDAEQAQREAEEARRSGAREELETREAEAADRADETLRAAFGDALERCPPSLLEALRVAELTYQKALYTELHPAAVAVLFSGALERGLYLLLVRPFDASLSPEARTAFLRGATRELRPGRIEYSERFVEAFDPARKARAPSLGEIARALARRREPQLAPFRRFLEDSLEIGDAFLDALAAFVERAKEQLRDPVAHGRALELPQAELARFRSELLLELGGSRPGALPRLVAARRRGTPTPP